MAAEHFAQPGSKVNDFALKLANVNGTGSSSANNLLMRAIFRMGVPVSGKNLFPSNIQGLPTWYEIRVNKDGHVARAREYDLMVAMNGQTYARDIAEVASGGFTMYDSSWPLDRDLIREDVTYLGVPLAEMCNDEFRGPRERILMKNIACAGALVAMLGIDMEVIAQLLTEQFAGKDRLRESNQTRAPARPRFRDLAFRLPAALPRRDHGRDPRLDPHRRQHGSGARLRLRGRHGRRLVSDHAVDVAHGRVCQVLRQVPARSRDRAQQLPGAAGRGRAGRDRHGARRVVGGSTRLHVDVGAGHLADAGAARHGLLRGDSGGDLRRAAGRSVDGDADSRAAVGHPDLRVRVARRHQARAAVPGSPRRVLRDGGEGVRPRGALPDSGVRTLRPRHRHERLGQPCAGVGRLLCARSRPRARRGRAARARGLSPLRAGRRRVGCGAHASRA